MKRRIARRWPAQRLRATVLLVALVLPFLVASNFGSTNPEQNPYGVWTQVSLANNKWHAVRWVTGDYAMLNSLQYSFQNDYNPNTDLYAYVDPYDPAPDLFAYYRDYGENGLAGWVKCNPANPGAQWGGAHPNFWCRGQDMNFNSYYGSFFDTATERQRLGCHETGHTVGLRHNYSDSHSCMKRCVCGSWLSGHDRWHINNTY